jgi:Zn-dependent metalloprotease
MRKKSTSKSGLFNPRILFIFTLCLAGASLALLSLAAPSRMSSTQVQQPANANAEQALASLQSANQVRVSAQVSRQTGNYNFVSADLLVADKISDTAQKRALTFLAAHGAVVGLNDAERSALSVGGEPTTGSALRILRTDTDSIGVTHVRLDQYYQGLRVFGAQLVIHMNNKGITAVNGDYVPQISFTTTPALAKAAGEQRAVANVRKNTGNAEIKVNKTELGIYPLG